MKRNLLIVLAAVSAGAVFVQSQRAASRQLLEVRGELAEQRRVLERLADREAPSEPRAVEWGKAVGGALGDLRHEVDHVAQTTRAPIEAPVHVEGPEEVASFGRASDVLRDALAAKHWTEPNRMEVRALMAGMSYEHRHDLRVQLVDALNAGAITAEVDGPPL